MQEVVFRDSLFFFATRYVFVLQLISTAAYPIHNGTVYVLHPMLIRFEMLFSTSARS